MKASGMIKIEESRKKTGRLHFFLWIILVLLIFTIQVSAADDHDLSSLRINTVVIDPGHGGYDTGGKGPDGTYEKDLTLKIAQILAKTLKPDYNVVLTRNGDYQVDLTQRASVANNKKGKVFISIHVGGGNRHEADVWSVFYYKKPEEKDTGRSVKPEKRGDIETQRFAWDRIQQAHGKESRVLAGCIKTQLAANPDIPEVVLASSDLRVLEGLDMPAVIIETGYLTNPTTEKRLKDPDFVADLAARIKKGIDVYLTR